MPPTKKKYDIVQILGLALAVVLLIGGNHLLQLRAQRWREEQAKIQKQLDEERAKLPPPEIKNSGAAVTTAPGATPPTKGDVQQPTPPAPAPAAAADVEPADAGDIKIASDELNLVFTAHGASLKEAVLSQAAIDPANKAVKGLEFLAELEAGKMAFGMPRFEMGPPDPQKKKEWLVFDADAGPQKALSKRVWKLNSNSGSFDAQGVWTLSYSSALAGTYTVSKTFTIYKSRRYVGLDVSVANQSGAPVSYSYTLYGAPGVLLDGPSADPKGGAYVSIVAELAGRDAPAAGQAVPEPDVQQVPPETAAKGDPEKSSVSKPENLWGGVKNRFYMAMLVSCDSAQLIRISAVPVANKINDPDKRLAEPNLGVLGTRRESAPLAAGATSAPDRYVLYMGPSNEAQLAAAETELALPQPVFLPTALRYCDMFNYSWPRVDWAARQMMTVFRALSYVFGNYGVAVILLTLLIKLALHPLQRKMMVSMNKMQKLQPELKKLQEKYKGQTSTQAKQRMFQEQQDIMRKGGASYSAGCLPMFVQLPILTALYGIFNRAFEMRGATFAWIQDLSQADRAFSLPFYPHELNLLPVIYAVLQLFQMRLTPQAPATDPQQEMQQTMMKYMPIMFSIMLYRMSSGLMLYFAASAVFGMVETWYIRKHLIKDLPGAATSNGKPPPAVVLTKAS